MLHWRWLIFKDSLVSPVIIRETSKHKTCHRLGMSPFWLFRESVVAVLVSRCFDLSPFWLVVVLTIDHTKSCDDQNLSRRGLKWVNRICHHHTDTWVAKVSGLFVPRTIRTLDYSYYGWTIRTLDDSYDGLFVRWTFRTTDYSYYGLFVPFTNITYADKFFWAALWTWVLR